MRKWLSRFFESRSPRKREFSLGLGNIYVFASRQGSLFLGLLVVTFIAGVNYGNNLILGLFFYLLSIWLVSAVVTFLQLSSLFFKFDKANLTQAGQLLWVEFSVESTKKPSRQVEFSFYPLDDRIFDNLDNPKKQSDLINKINKLSEAERQVFLTHKSIKLSAIDKPVIVRLPVLTEKRGFVDLPRLNIKSTYPLGVVQAWSYGYFDEMGLAYPVPLDFDDKSETKASTDGDASDYQVGQDEFDRLDSYKDGESLARVSWSHFARGAGMLTKHFGDPAGQSVAIRYDGMPAAAHEDKLSQMTAKLLKIDTATPFVFALPSGEWSGVGDAFIDSCLEKLAKEP